MRTAKAYLGSLCLASIVAGLAFGGAAFAAADTTIITKRQGVMTGHADHAKAIVAFIKEGQGTPTDVAKRAGAISETAKLIPSLFPEGTGMDEVEDPRTGAKPEIWLDWEGFEKAAKNLEAEALKLMEVAAGGDAAAIAAQFDSFGKKGCGGCHKSFRQKLE
jgi:cytochrome c556